MKLYHGFPGKQQYGHISHHVWNGHSLAINLNIDAMFVGDRVIPRSSKWLAFCG